METTIFRLLKVSILVTAAIALYGTHRLMSVIFRANVPSSTTRLNSSRSSMPHNCSSSNEFLMTSESVYMDSICFPPYLTLPNPTLPLPPVDSLDVFHTPKWSSSTCLQRKNAINFIAFHSLDAVVKRFTNATLWRTGEKTFFQGDGVFSFSQRCHLAGDVSLATPPLQSSLSSAPFFPQVYLNTLGIWGDGYFHYMAEEAFALGGVQSLLRDFPSLKILVSEPKLKLMEFATQILKIPASQFIFQNILPLRTGEVFVPYYTSCGGVTTDGHPFATRTWIRSLHEHLYPKIRAFPSSASDIVLIHRNESGRCNRCLQNSDELVHTLKQSFPNRNVHLITLASMTLNHVMELFSQTELLIAPHGAGLVNMIFLPDHAKVIEIFNHPTSCNPVFYNLARNFRLYWKGSFPLIGLMNMANITETMSIARRLLLSE